MVDITLGSLQQSCRCFLHVHPVIPSYQKSHTMQIIPSDNPTSSSPPTPSTPSLFSPKAILQKLWSMEGSYYVGDANIASKAKFFVGNVKKGNVLVINNQDTKPTKFLLCSAFEIDKWDFYFVADGNFNLNNKFGFQLADVKASCHLVPICHDNSFRFSHDDYATAMANIQAIEKLIPTFKGKMIISVLYPMSETGSSQSIKLLHNLFQVSPETY